MHYIFMDDGTIVSTKGGIAGFRPGQVPSGYAPLKYEGPDDGYYEWVGSLREIAYRENKPKSYAQLLTSGRIDADEPILLLIDLAERWDVSWQTIKGLVDSEAIKPEFMPCPTGVNVESGAVNYLYRVFVSLVKVLEIEEKNPELKLIAQGHSDRRIAREEKYRQKRASEKQRCWFRLEKAIKQRGWTLSELESKIIEGSFDDFLARVSEMPARTELVALRSLLEEKDARIFA